MIIFDCVCGCMLWCVCVCVCVCVCACACVCVCVCAHFLNSCKCVIQHGTWKIIQTAQCWHVLVLAHTCVEACTYGYEACMYTNKVSVWILSDYDKSEWHYFLYRKKYASEKEQNNLVILVFSCQKMVVYHNSVMAWPLRHFCSASSSQPNLGWFTEIPFVQKHTTMSILFWWCL